MLDALWIVIWGMAIIFAVLGVLLLAMALVTRLTRTRETKESG